MGEMTVRWEEELSFNHNEDDMIEAKEPTRNEIYSLMLPEPFLERVIYEVMGTPESTHNEEEKTIIQASNYEMVKEP